MLLTEEIEMTWNTTDRLYYENLGCIFTKYNDRFIVSIDHLHKGSNKRVNVRCDYCGREYERIYSDYVSSIENSSIKKYACQKCYMKYKRFEEIDILQENEQLKKGDSFYWYYHKNRLNEFKNILYNNKIKNIDDFINGNTNRDLYLALFKYKEFVEDLLKELGWSLEEIMEIKPRPTRKYFNNINNIIDRIQWFIDKNKRFPNKKEIIKVLKIDQMIIDKNGGIYELKRKMNYIDKFDYIDDNLWLNRSYYEYCVAQFLIKYNIYYKREQNPFLKSKHRSDFTIYNNSDVIHIEIFGFPENSDCKRNDRYLKNKKKKLSLYKEYDISLIVLEYSIFYNKSVVEIYEKLKDIFSNFISGNKKIINYDFLRHPHCISDEELLNELMIYSIDQEYLPKWSDLKNVKKDYLGREVKKRYKTYLDFAKKFNKKVYNRNNSWNNQLILEKLIDMIKSGIFINKINMNNYCKGLYDALVNHGNQIKYKLDALNKCINDMKIITKEVEWLNNVINNRGLHIKNKATSEQRQQAQEILNKLQQLNNKLQEVV